MASAPSILIVDHSPDDVLLLKRVFKKAGVANPMSWVHSGQDAIAYIKGLPPFHDRTRYPLPSVILIDLQMPDEGGFEVLQWIRNKFPSGGLLIIVLTRIDELNKINRAYALGANSFLTKPGKPEDLQELIRIFNGYWLLRNPFQGLPGLQPSLENLFQ